MRCGLYLASMGPPPFGDGNMVAVTRFVVSTPLQWGHRLSAMETTVVGSGTIIIRATLQWGHRLSAMETGVDVRLRRPGCEASMGPPPFGDGNAYDPGCLPFLSDSLQWGHRLSAMDTVPWPKPPAVVCMLQWGHRLSAMETYLSPEANRQRWSRFNGATAFRRWKPSGHRGL